MIDFVLRQLTASRVNTGRNKLCCSPTIWQGWVTAGGEKLQYSLKRGKNILSDWPDL